ncbi:DNA gyrase inhibitor YacG [Arsenophonus sp.]|uniref:DNA gyrase inhibitor YacG n=1 Tax=Arsenophonus sp. TaxID=1872640 RepID=UPI00387A17AF
MPDMLTVKCPTCHKIVIWQESSPYRPFCSKRCRLIDLGECAGEEKRISSQRNISEIGDWSEISDDHDIKK